MLGPCNDALDKLEEEFGLEIIFFYLRHFLNKTGEGAGGKFNGPSIKTVLKNLDVISHHYSDYFKMTGKTFRETNGEHHEALHHTLKTIERNKNLYMKKKSWWGCSPTKKPPVNIYQECVKCRIYSKSQAKDKKKQSQF